MFASRETLAGSKRVQTIGWDHACLWFPWETISIDFLLLSSIDPRAQFGLSPQVLLATRTRLDIDCIDVTHCGWNDILPGRWTNVRWKRNSSSKRISSIYFKMEMLSIRGFACIIDTETVIDVDHWRGNVYCHLESQARYVVSGCWKSSL